MQLALLKGVEACRRLRAFDDEFQTWLEVSKVGKDFQRHGSQIRALETMLKSFRDGVGALVACDNAPTTEPQLNASTEASRLALALFGIWDFFRVKLDQRRNDSYAGALRQADELAWVCYRPVREVGLKEPPLVFFNGGTSPFILRRDVAFNADGVPVELAASESIVEATAHLPFPVIGVPWTHMNHLADAVVIAHEVGHAVEADLHLQTDLDDAIEVALERAHGKDRGKYWQAWRPELFADLYGCLSMGPAFARALRDFLAAPETEVAGEQPRLSSSYPPASVRVRFNATVLDRMGFETVEGLWQGWQNVYPTTPAVEPYAQDAVEVASEMYTTPLHALNQKPITSLMRFTADQHVLANNLASKAAAKQQLPNTSDLRALFAATRLAYDADPKGYDREPAPKAKSTLERLRAQINVNIADVYRSKEDPYSNTHNDRHRRRGIEWLQSIRARGWGDPDS